MNRRERREAARDAYRGKGLKGADKAKAVRDLAASLPGGNEVTLDIHSSQLGLSSKIEQPRERVLTETESGLIVPTDA